MKCIVLFFEESAKVGSDIVDRITSQRKSRYLQTSFVHLL